MLLLRALNEYDQIINSEANGIASKQLIYNTTLDYLKANEKKRMDGLSIKEQDLYVKEYMKKFLFDHYDKLEKKFRRRHQNISNIINHLFINKEDYFDYYYILKELSTLPNHLINGSRTITNWISTTDNIKSVFKYYNNQDVHQMAVLDIDTNGLFSSDTLAVDVSNKETINKFSFLSKKIDLKKFKDFIECIKGEPRDSMTASDLFDETIITPVKQNFMGFNFSVASKEFSIYEYIPKEYVKRTLEPLEIDLLFQQILTVDYFDFSWSEQKEILKDIKQIIMNNIEREQDNEIKYLFEELYINNKNIFKNISEVEKDKLINKQAEFFYKVEDIPDFVIRQRTK